MKMKICTKCHVRKAILQFTKDSSKKDGLRPSCRGCSRIQKGNKKKVFRKRIVNGSAFFRCPGCKKSKSREGFYSNPTNKDGIHSECKMCSIKRSKSELSKARQKGRRQIERMEALIYYGGQPPKCECCELKNIEFLCIDHIEGGGNQQRKQAKNGHFYRWLKKNNFPKGYRILCHNCNMSLGFYGYCPHKI